MAIPRAAKSAALFWLAHTRFLTYICARHAFTTELIAESGTVVA